MFGTQIVSRTYQFVWRLPGLAVCSSNSNIIVRRRYRKALQDMLQNGSICESASLLQILELKPSIDRPDHYDVHCLLPWSATTAPDELPNYALPFSLASHLEGVMNGSRREIKNKLPHSYKTQKLPTFKFVIHVEGTMQQQIKTSPIQPDDSADFTFSTPMVTADLTSISKPFNVYGLDRNQLLQKMRAFTSSHQDTSSSMAVNRTDRVRSEWLNVWKQQQDSRLQGRRDRKRAQRNHGLYRLQTGSDGRVQIEDFEE